MNDTERKARLRILGEVLAGAPSLQAANSTAIWKTLQQARREGWDDATEREWMVAFAGAAREIASTDELAYPAKRQTAIRA